MRHKEERESKCGRYLVILNFESEEQKHPYGDTFVTESLNTLICEDFFVDDVHHTFEELTREERDVFNKLLEN